MALTQVQPGMLGTPQPYNFKNRIINGAMVIDQRNAGASITPTNGQYSVDRFFGVLSQASKYTLQQNAGSVTPPVGFTNYLGATSSSAYSLVAGDYFAIQQKIEGFNIADLGWGTANAKAVTVSFQAYSSLTGTFGGALNNAAGNRCYPFTYSIPVANTWTTISVTISGDTTGTWNTNNLTGLLVSFGLGVGTTYSGTAGAWSTGPFFYSATGAVSVVGTSGATFYITGVQLEVGTTATNFEVRDYGSELTLCQRYTWVCSPTAFLAGIADSTTTIWATIKFAVTMRAAPSATLTSGNVGFSDDYVADYVASSPTINTSTTGPDGGRFRITGFSGLTQARFYSGIGGTASAVFSSEL
jgi:hypothetical protein